MDDLISARNSIGRTFCTSVRTSGQRTSVRTSGRTSLRLITRLAAVVIFTILSVNVSGATLPQQVLLVENHSDVLVPWIATGVRGAAVVNLDAHDDCIPIAATHLHLLKDLFTKGDIAAIGRYNGVTDSSLYDLSNYITAAHALGVAREALWAVPLPGSLSKKYPHLLFRTCLIDSLSYVNIKGPVFLTVDADCIDPYARYRCINLVEAVNQIATTLRGLPWDVRHLSVSFSHEGGYLPITLRWVGYALKDALEGNDLKQPNALWTTLANANEWRRSILPAENVRRLRPLLVKHPKNPWLHAYMADALFRADSITSAFAEGKKAMLLDSGCAPILTDIGGELAIMKRFDDAERFLAAAPKVINSAAELALAQWLDQSGKTARSIEHYKRIGKQVANYSADILIGYGYERLGDTANARQYYLHAVALLEKPVSEMAGFADLTLAVTAAELFLRNGGNVKSADVLRRDHRLSAYFRKQEK